MRELSINVNFRRSLVRRVVSSCALAVLFCSVPVMSSCGGGGSSSTSGGGGTTSQAATPVIATAAALNGAVIVTLSDSTSGAAIYYTVDGATPTTSSPRYIAPFLLSSDATVKALAVASGDTNSSVASQAFTLGIASGTLVWSDEFANSTTANAAPSTTTWTYDTGAGGWGNSELETYCAYGSTTSPCDASNPNVYVGTDGYLHILARNPSSSVYTSARMKTQGLFSTSYGRIEARIKMPEGQGLWPAFWTLGNSESTVGWPACGEQDIMEHINAPSPDWIAGSLHGTNMDLSTQYSPSSFSAADWHTYGILWTTQSIKFYVDDPANIYATYTPSSMTESGAVWPFDTKGGAFIILNMAVGGSWPGSPNTSTTFPSEMLVDYVRVYSN
ncbi:MAG: family 16 glycosylhydrolase [Acidobacteriota bacterium]|nr:family 16 glycosylhydrolase [Acidobacteriota bacterium]